MVDGMNSWNFKRGLDEDFMAQLEPLAHQPGWFKDVLGDRDLVLGIRDNSLAIYWRGCRLFHVERRTGGALKVSTHPKYLVDPDLRREVVLSDTIFETGEASALIKAYVEQGSATLKRMKRAASRYALPEKEGVHAIVCRNPRNPDVVDTEIAFRQQDEDNGHNNSSRLQRLDIASFERVNNRIFLRFWEAKCYTNSELFATSDKPKVDYQIEHYKGILTKHRDQILLSYEKVSANLVKMADWAKRGSEVGTLVREVSQYGRLAMDDEPVVGLVIFGFDEDQKNGKNFSARIGTAANKGKLRTSIWPLIAVGDARNARLAAGAL
jgi:hypothetical protein